MILSQKKYGGTRLISEKMEALYPELNERAEAATSIYSATGDFYNIFILCLWLGIIRRSFLGVQFMNFPSQMFFNAINHDYRAVILKKKPLWLLLFYMAVATSCYYGQVRKTMRTAIVLYLLNRAYFTL